jgi:Rrf2 family protein
MLTFSKKVDYGLIALSHLATDEGHKASARQIAEKFGVPLPILMNILKTLAHRGLVTSLRGAKGGYVLAVDPHLVSVGRIVLALEGPIRMVECVGPPLNGAERCRVESKCPIKMPAWKLHGRLMKMLDEITLADFASDAFEPATPLTRV